MNIENFYDPNSSRTYLTRPWQLDGRTIACNGHIFISMPEHDEYDQCPADCISKFAMIIDKATQPGEFVPMPANLVFPETTDCPLCLGVGKSTQVDCQECHGEGEVCWNSGFHDYEAECQTCDGDGVINTVGGEKTCTGCFGTGTVYGLDKHIEILGLWINPKYLKLICDEPGTEISVDEEQNRLIFKIGEDYGLIMAMSQN